MTEDNNNRDDESDGEENDEKSLKTRAKLAVLALWAWIKPRSKSAVGRVRDELAQAMDELAPQLRGVLDGVRVPKRALKPLALVVVLLFTAVALGPAAPFAGNSGPVDNGTEPVVGTTYEPVDDGEYRNVVTSRLGSLTSDAPPAPNEVRASAGSQTMSVETAVRDGEPAIVLEDDRTHDGRWVAIETSWFDEHVGEVPDAAYIEHENGSEYASPIETRGGEAAFYVQGFSTNTVTFSGEFAISSTSTDGDSIEYTAPNGGDDLSINVTGVTNSETQTVSAGNVSNGDTFNLDIGGNEPPSNATVKFTGAEAKDGSFSIVDSNGDGTADSDHDYSIGDGNFDNAGRISTEFTPSFGGDISSTDLNLAGTTGSDYGFTVDVYIAEGGADSSWTDGTLVASNWNPDFSTGTQTVPFDTDYSVSSGEKYHITFVTSGSDNDGTADTIDLAADTSPTTTVTAANLDGAENERYLDIDFDYSSPATENPSIDVDGDGSTDASYSGTLAEAESTTVDLTDLTLSDGPADVYTDSGTVGVEVTYDARTSTVDPVVGLNGNSVSHSGTLADGETVTLAANDSWIAEGQNTVTVSVGDGTLSASSPAPQVALDYRHDVSKSRTIDYTGETFSERYAVSESWNEDIENASLTIPWASDRVISLRSVTVEHRGADGTVVQTIDSPSYAFENGSVMVEFGDVQAGWETTVSAAGSKVQVENADLTVLKPTAQGNDLNSTLRLSNPGDDVYLRVGATEQGQQLHYLANSSWDATEASRISADGTNEIRIPNAPDNGETELRTLPLAFDVTGGAIDVAVPEERANADEPVYRVGPGEQVGDSYSVSHVEAADGQPYVLYDETDEIVLDQGLGPSPLTLSATEPDSPHVIQFREDDGTASGSDGGSLGDIGGGAAPMVTNSQPFSALGALVPGPGVVVALLGGIVGLAVLSRETSLFNEGTRSDAVADAAKDVGVRIGGLVERLLGNEIVVAVVMLGAGAWLLASGIFGPTERLIVALGSVPVAMYLALRQFGTFDFRVWAGSTAVVAVLGVVVLAPDAFESLAQEAGVIIVAGGLILGWRALSAWRAEASTPDSVTNLEIQTSEDDDGK